MKNLREPELPEKISAYAQNRSLQQTPATHGEALKKVCTNVLGIPAEKISVVHLQTREQLEAFARQWKDSNK